MLDITEDYIGVPGQFYIQKELVAGCVEHREHTVVVDNCGARFEIVGRHLETIRPHIQCEKLMPGPLGSIWSMRYVRSAEMLKGRRFIKLTMRTNRKNDWVVRLKLTSTPYKRSVMYRTRKVWKQVGFKLPGGRRMEKEVSTEEDTDEDDPNCSVFE